MNLNTEIQQSLASLERVYELFDIKPEAQGTVSGISDIRGDIEISNLTFSYDTKSYALKDISFRASPGEMIALVGKSGAGKTTLTKMILRFYDPQEGEILLDGENIKNLRLSELRNCLGLVPQDTFLFSGSIKENNSGLQTSRWKGLSEPVIPFSHLARNGPAQ